MGDRVLGMAFAHDGSSVPRRYATKRAAELPSEDAARRWLVEELWVEEGVGIIGANPKSLKTWAALDVAVAVASGTLCLGRFRVPSAGKVLLFNAEERPALLRERLCSLCASRMIDLTALDVAVIDAPSADLALT